MSLYSLQVGVDASKIQPWLDNQRVNDLSPLINDFIDTACLIQQLDLVITIDTAVAHLAGAMGKPVWVMLPFIPDWRWQLDRLDSPWYPTMRLFRQPRQGDWGTVFQQVKEKLIKVLQGQSPIFPVKLVKPEYQLIQTEAVERVEAKAFKQINSKRNKMSKSRKRKSKSKNLHSVSQPVLNRATDHHQLEQLITKKIDLGIEHHQAERLKEAEACYQQVLEWQPNNADAWHLSGVIAYQQEQYTTAIERINKAIALNAQAANFYNSLGSVYQKLYQFDQALECYQNALKLEPNFFKTHNNIGLVYQEQGEYDQAIKFYQKAIQLQPNYAEAHLNLSITYEKQTKLAQAIAFCHKAIELQGSYADAYCQLGRLLSKQAKPQEAIEAYRQALDINPNYAVAHHDLMFSLLYYNSHYEPEAIAAEHRKWAERHGKPLAEEIKPHENDRNPERRLRIGYVSGDFKTHSVAYFLEPLLAAHNTKDFEIICYTNTKTTDATTKRLQKLADGWREIYPLNDEQVENLIRQDAIDILVDLSGHTMGNRLLVFARKPAPVQVTYIGYPSTTGLDTIDYRFTDAWADPEGQTEHLHSEQLLRLPHGFLCYQPPSNYPEVSPPPVLTSNQITFGSFNNLAKVNPELIGCWAEILKAVPNSRMILKSKPLVDPDTCNYLHGLFQQQGIEAERVELIGWLADQSQHLELYNQVDIALDTFPYHGTTTTCEALWMGVPVITQAGQTHVSRVGVSLLSSVGLEELIAESAKDYIHKAIDLATNQEQLKQLRKNLRSRIQVAPLTNASLIAQSLENAYRNMWRRFCGQIPMAADERLVEIKEGVKVCVKNDLNSLTTYVLLEQGDWFESEMDYIRKLITPRMHILDIGANHGVYTLTMAKLLQGQGQVTAYEPAHSVFSMLQTGVEANALTTVEVVNAGLSDHEGEATLFTSTNSEYNSLYQKRNIHQQQEAIQLLTLDGELEKRKWKAIDFIKLDAEGEEAKILTGGQRFFSERSPLVMFELAAGNEINLPLIQQFQALGYDTYRLVPGLGLLAPFDDSQPIDFQLNLFACKTDRAEQLAERELLVRKVVEKPAVPKPSYWLDAIATLNYATPFLSQWQKLAASPKADSQLYLEGLNYFLLAQSGSLSPAEQLAALQHSFECLQQAVRANPSFARRCTLARVAAEFGRRQVSVENLKELVEVPNSGSEALPDALLRIPNSFDEPFLLVNSQYDHQSFEDNLQDWLFVSILETYENSRVFSSYFCAEKSVSLLSQVVQKPFHSRQTKRRLSFAQLVLKGREYAIQIYQKDPHGLRLGLNNFYSEKNKTLYGSRNNPNNGFFSILSVYFWGIIDLYNQHILPEKINFADEFLAYKNQEQIQKQTDVYPYYFRTDVRKDIEFNKKLPKHDHHGIYKNYDFFHYNLLVQKYFNLSDRILEIQDFLIKKYEINFSKTIVVCYRGTDKYTEIKLADPNSYLNLAEKILRDNPDHKILIQTDQKQVRDLFVNYFKNRCFFLEEMPVTKGRRALHANVNTSSLDKFEFGKLLLAVTHLLSKCHLIINHTGNMAAWICLFRGNADGVWQFDREGTLILPTERLHSHQQQDKLQIGNQYLEEQHPTIDRSKFILIKAWGYGFWSDVDHILGQLLIAELTDRIPIVHWGDNSRYRDAEDENAFENYFEPISPYKIDDLIGQSYKFYPSKWTEDNLKSNNVNKWEGPGSCLSGSSLLSQNEDVVVSDFHSYVYDLMSSIPPHHLLADKSPQEIYRYLCQKYLKIRPEINQEIEEFWSEHLAGHHTLAVHVRGSGKIIEMADLDLLNQKYREAIARYLKAVPDILIFLLTDDKSVLEEYKQIYGERLRYTNVSRTQTNTSIHYQKHPSRKKIGIEIIKDTYLAAKCDYFIGNGHSNVSTTILHLKDWQEDQYVLVKRNNLFIPHQTKTQPISLSFSVEKILEVAISLHQAGQLQKAEQHYQKVLQWQPNHADGWHLLGVIAAQQKQYSTAIERINRAIELKPESATFYSNLGNAYQESGQLAQAIKCYQKVIQLQPNHVDTYKNMGIAFKEQGNLEEAVQAYQKVLQLKPDYADAYYNLANALQQQGKIKEAIEYLQKTLQLLPDHAEAHNNLAGALQSQGKLKEAIPLFERALKIKPDYAKAHSNLLFSLHYSDYEPEAIYAEHRKWAERHGQPLAANIQPHNNERYSERRLRIGYVSGDFRSHSVAYFLEPLLANHNQPDFEVICYTNNKKVDATTERLRQLADGWREIYDLEDEQVAELIRKDRIDILVDLSGHTKDNRMLVFARKAAPVQVTYIGYPNTTGLDTIDYRLTDAWADPEGKTEHLHTEQLVRLPYGFLCYQAPADCPEVSPLPVLKTGQITFASFNNLAKVNPTLIGDWAEILKAVPHSRLIIKSKPLVDADTCAYVHELFQQQGIESDRIELLGWLPDKTQHLSLYQRVDIALDTFPYNGTTTTCEAMWMGVPVITLAGQSHVSRVGFSLLSSVGLEELIAQSAKDYIQKAVELAGNKERRQQLRTNLRSWMQAAPLTNGSLMAQSVEESYRKMWRSWCSSHQESILEASSNTLKNAPKKIEQEPVVKPQAKTRQTEKIEQDNSPARSRKLHIGGTVRVPGWEVLNALPGDYVDHLGNAKDLSQFPDHTFTDVYASHVVEHFDYMNELVPTLQEWYRVLVAGGKIYISVPDLDILARLFLDKQQLTLKERFQVMRMMFGGHVSPYDYHQVGLNQELLTEYLQAAGFTQIRRVDKFGFFNDTSNGRFKGIPISLNVIAQKPIQSNLSSESNASVERDFKIAVNHHQAGRLQEAEKLYQQVLQKQPENANALHLLGVIASQQGKYQIAIEQIKKAIELNPNSPSYYYNLGNAYQEQGQLSQAIECYQKVIQLQPDYAEAYKNLGMAYKKQDKLPEAMLNYGIYHHKQEQFQQAIESYQQAIQFQPNYAVAYYNLGNVYQEQGELSEAVESFRKAIQLKSNYVKAHADLGLVLLLMGKFRQGFSEYEWRFKTPQLKNFKQLKTSMWDGSPLEGKSIVVGNEQGLGDAIQFVRYAKLLQEQGAKVILSTHPALVSLFRDCLEGQFEVREESACNVYDYDCHVSLMSLPGLFKTSLDNIPNSVPYIKPPSAFRSDCVLPPADSFRIGIVWATGKLNTKLYTKKSSTSEFFIDFLNLGDISLYSLQVGEDAPQIQPWLEENERVHDLSPLLKDFVDTACVIEQLDLVITVDTAVAHLAGAMGKPVWVLLPFIPDWRWLMERQDSPWYPTMQLFRQPSRGDWVSVFQQVKEKLQSVLEGELML